MKKICIKCKIKKELADFHKDKKTGHKPRCKSCRKIDSAKWNKKYKDKNKERSAIYRKNNKEKIQKRSKEYCKLNRNKISVRNKIWRESNKQKIKVKASEYNKINKTNIGLYNKKWRTLNKDINRKNDAIKYEKNKDVIRKRTKEWRNNNMEKYKKLQRRSHLLKKYGITIDKYNEMLIQQNAVCAICHKPEIFIDSRSNILLALSIDHNHRTGNIRGLLCRSCNLGLGYFKDSAISLRDASNYLESSNKISDNQTLDPLSNSTK